MIPISCAVANIVFLAALATGATADPMLDRTVEEVYVPQGDILTFLPELLAQLDIPAAGIDLGKIGSRNILEKDPRPGGTLADVVQWNPERQLKPLEMKRATVRQVLDELVRRRPELSWFNEVGVLLITSSADKDSLVRPALNYHVPQFKVERQPLNEAAASIEKIVTHALPATEKTVAWSMIGWRMHPVLSPRQALDVPVTLAETDVSVRHLLGDLVRQAPGAFWIAYDQLNDPYLEPRDRYGEITISRLGGGRALDLETLVRCLDDTYAPLHGYKLMGCRMDDAKNELCRRYHFHAAEVRQALLKPDGLPGMIVAAQSDLNARELVGWACNFRDRQLTEALVALIPAIKNPDRRYECFLGFTTGTAAEESALQKYMPLWKRMVTDDDPRVRQAAQQMIDWAQPKPGAKP